jgi:hypothetical protein
MRENYPEVMPMQAALGMKVDLNPTVEENIDSRINNLRKEIERLEQSKIDLAPLLNMRIRDIRSAMEVY